MIPASLLEELRREKKLVVTVKAIPKSSKNEIVGRQPDGSFKVKITAAPEKGKANAAICELLAEAFGVSKRNVTILRGQTSANKQIAISL